MGPDTRASSVLPMTLQALRWCLPIAALLSSANCSPSPSGRDTAAATPRPARDGHCTGDGSPCQRFGVEGECLGNVCVVGGGYCSSTIDCDDGEACTTEACERGRCVLKSSTGCVEKPAALPSTPSNDCKIVFDAAVGYKSQCPTSGSSGSSKQGGPDDPKAVGDKLAQSIERSYRYDVKIALIALHDGSFNIVVLNRRPPTEIRGMLDPSFIAWRVADFTAATAWRSRNLHIWTKPYKEGWSLSTWASRDAVRKARSDAVFGAYGIIDAPTFRTWLEKHFKPLPAQ